jgi:hypothetical protein
VGVEKRTVPAGESKTVEKEFITLLTADGLKTLALDTITRIKLVDPRLQGSLRRRSPCSPSTRFRACGS